MPTHKSSDYKLSAVKYYLSHSKNQVQTCKIFGCSERSLMRWVDKYKSTNNITRKKRDYQHYTNAIEGYFNVLKSRLQKKKGLTYNELVSLMVSVIIYFFTTASFFLPESFFLFTSSFLTSSFFSSSTDTLGLFLQNRK